MKKTFVKHPLGRALALLLCLTLLAGTALFAAAQKETGVISVKLNSDIAGLTANDAAKLIELKSGNVIYSTRGDGPVSIADYAGTAVTGPLKAGRTYDIYYTLSAADGYTLPEQLTDSDLEIECGKGVRVISKHIVTANIRDDSGAFVSIRGVMIYAVVVVDGNIFQRIIGCISDMILKIKAWSLY